MSLHQASEFSALGSHSVNRFLEHVGGYLAGGDKTGDLLLCDTHHLGYLLRHRNASPHKLAHILSEHSPLCYRRSVEIHQIPQRKRQACRYVSELNQRVVDIFGSRSIGEQLLGTLCHALQVKRSGGGGAHQLVHQLALFLAAAEHCLECNLQLLELTADIDHLHNEVLYLVHGERPRDTRRYFCQRIVNHSALTNKCSSGIRRRLLHLVKTCCRLPQLVVDFGEFPRIKTAIDAFQFRFKLVYLLS